MILNIIFSNITVIISFIFTRNYSGSVMYSMMISAPLGTVSKGIGAAFGLASIIICAIGALHATYAWSLTCDSDADEKYMTGNLSTLV